MRYANWTVSHEASKDRNLTETILQARGYQTPQELETFLRADMAGLYDPMLLPDMAQAVARIETALQHDEKIMVYGDYDVDGITASALLTDYLRQRGAYVAFFIPHRIEHGYGLHAPTLQQFHKQGVSLLITVDVGVTAFDAVETANACGLDVVITDHHACRDTLPAAVAVVNPLRNDSQYPFRGLAGVGVAFKLVCALAGSHNTKKLLQRYGDLVSLGTVADVMPLVDENRILVRHGLPLITTGSRAGLRALCKVTGCIDKPVTANTVAFSLAPVLNAAGRMASAILSAELLLTTDEAQGTRMAQELINLNTDRRNLEAEIFKQAVAQWEADSSQPSAIVLQGEHWNAGVTGIVATRLLEKYDRPVFLLSVEGDICKGSARAPAGVHLPTVLAACQSFLSSFGGHAAAAGFTLPATEFAAFKEALIAACDMIVRPDESTLALTIDCAITADLLTKHAAQDVCRMGPFGAANPEPILLLRQAQLQQVVPLKEGKHLKLFVMAQQVWLPVICFGFTASEFPFSSGDVVDLAFVLSLNHFRGEATVQLELRDIRRSPEIQAQYTAEQAQYHLFVSKQPLSIGDLQAITPNREALVAVWRGLNRMSTGQPELRLTLWQLLNEVAYPSLGPGKLLVALDVFAELALLEYRAVQDMLTITVCKDGRKVNLQDSKVLASLKQ